MAKARTNRQRASPGAAKPPLVGAGGGRGSPPDRRETEMSEITASRYHGLRCSSVNRDGMRCEREAGHAEIRSRTGQLHRAEPDGVPAVWSERI